MHLQLVSMVSMATHPFDRVGREIEDSTRTCCLLLTAHCSPLYCLLLTTHYEQLTFLIA